MPADESTHIAANSSAPRGRPAVQDEPAPPCIRLRPGFRSRRRGDPPWSPVLAVTGSESTTALDSDELWIDCAGDESQSPEGSWSDFQAVFGKLIDYCDLEKSQSPEGSWSDFHLAEIAHVVQRLSQDVAIPRRVLVRFLPGGISGGAASVRTCRNPPKGPGPISTWQRPVYYEARPRKIVAIPRRVLVRFPHDQRKRMRQETPLMMSQSPEGSWSDFHVAPHHYHGSFIERRCRNPPKGPGPISTSRVFFRNSKA